MSRNNSTSSMFSSSSTSIHRYSKSGIGGIGNFHKTSNMSPSHSPSCISARTSGTFSTSIGGAGNIRQFSERPIISSFTRLEREEVRERNKAKIWYFGIGGAGNKTGVREAEKMGSVASFESSKSGGESNADRMRNVVVGIFGRKMDEMVGSSMESLSLKS